MTYSGIPPYPDRHTGMPRRRTRAPRLVVILVPAMASLLVLSPVALVVAFFHVSGENHGDLRFPSQDVSISSCRKDAVRGGPVAGVRVVSRAKRRGTYRVDLRFRDPRGKGGSDAAGKRTVVFKDLAVGATATREIAGPVPVRGRPQCVVADVTFLSTEPAEASKPATP
ncbi:hypothetical protein OG782_23955 [Streptomyces sp. NBC_00876]|uniref:hypothetical protein n=1 Tax=Streptomyces sp. NBC_00876 TaxID=2975853 RepID=UPI0038650B3D|nr:hypothetical protein OG782_23955 [Streptomyces sp. NBC_00876]